MDGPWLFGRRTDLLLFGSSAALGLVVLILGRLSGGADGDAPPWLFLWVLVFVDTAHVWATGWRVLADRGPSRARLPLTLGVPLAAWAAGAALYSVSELLFWRALAYFAIFHVVRQQYGWAALYRRKNGEGEEGRLLDAAVIYGAMLTPIVFWHTRFPRFSLFLPGELFSGLPAACSPAALAAYGAVFAAWVAREIRRARRGAPVSWGKALIVLSTTATWFLGTVVLNADWAFTVANVFSHGVPYLGLVWLTSRRSAAERAAEGLAPTLVDRAAGNIAAFLVPLLLIAPIQYYGSNILAPRDPVLSPPVDGARAVLLALSVSLLAVPLVTHYVLDGILWRMRPANRRAMGFMSPAASP